MSKLVAGAKKYSYVLLVLFLIVGLIDIRFGMAAVVCMVAPVLVSLKRGRFWCGNICPRGNFYDTIVSKFSKKRKVPAFFRTYWFRAIVLIFIMTMFIKGMYMNWGNWYKMGFILYRMIAVTTIIGIILAFFFSHRTWCSFCPMGTLASLVSKIKKKKKTLHVSKDCVSCKLCEKACVMDIAPYTYKGSILEHPDCISCKKCVAVCPKDCIYIEEKQI